jgi:hypothetical protein
MEAADGTVGYGLGIILGPCAAGNLKFLQEINLFAHTGLDLGGGG